MKLFLVGAGALGCELLKNLAVMGVSCSSNADLLTIIVIAGGEIIVTDLDTVSFSNLHRQLLFKKSDVDQPKSDTASRSAKEINNSLSIKPLMKEVSPLSEAYFNETFWESLDAVVVAVDNLKARTYIDIQVENFAKLFTESAIYLIYQWWKEEQMD